MSVYDERPWLKLYAPGLPHDIEPEHASMLAAFRHTAARVPEQTAVQYFDTAIRYAMLAPIVSPTIPAMMIPIRVNLPW